MSTEQNAEWTYRLKDDPSTETQTDALSLQRLMKAGQLDPDRHELRRPGETNWSPVRQLLRRTEVMDTSAPPPDRKKLPLWKKVVAAVVSLGLIGIGIDIGVNLLQIAVSNKLDERETSRMMEKVDAIEADVDRRQHESLSRFDGQLADERLIADIDLPVPVDAGVHIPPDWYSYHSVLVVPQRCDDGGIIYVRFNLKGVLRLDSNGTAKICIDVDWDSFEAVSDDERALDVGRPAVATAIETVQESMRIGLEVARGVNDTCKMPYSFVERWTLHDNRVVASTLEPAALAEKKPTTYDVSVLDRDGRRTYQLLMTDRSAMIGELILLTRVTDGP